MDAERVLVCRANATPELGGGHAMRLIALADAHVRGGGRVRFVTNAGAETVCPLLATRNYEIVRSEHDIGGRRDLENMANVTQDAWAIVADDYRIGNPYFTQLRDRAPVVAIDDLCDRTVDVDVIVNPNFGAESLRYRCRKNAVQCLGTRYAMLRDEILGVSARPGDRHSGVVPRLLVTFGASDPVGATAKVLRCLPLGKVHIVCVLGPGFAALTDFTTAAKRWLDHEAIDILQAPEQLGEVFAGCDFAISGSGGTLWELSYLNIPTLALAIVNNQESVARRLVKAGCNLASKPLTKLDDTELATLFERFLLDDDARARCHLGFEKLVDGHGAERVLDAIKCLR